MKNIKEVFKGEEPKRAIDDTKIVDAICRLKSYLNIADVYINHYVMNEELSDFGVIIDDISLIVKELETEYMSYK